ncbi:rhomboid family intramembrane serine protease [Capnocytophaga canimorsus]|uniref:rhomboid family intramembrane serine protease n=1 Tax=Capnocytophaga canimorsus TaxID=28188 RepID=UPI0037D819A8
MERITQAIKHLIIINVVLFFVAELGLVLHLKELMAIWYFQNPNFHLWQFVTHMFMHGDLMHLFFNMYALWAFGTPLESIWGKQKFLFFYFSCAIGAALMHLGVNYYYYQQGVEALTAVGVPLENINELAAEGKYLVAWSDIVSMSTLKNMVEAYAIPAVGASGAIYGILVAFGMMFPEARLMLFLLPIPIKAKYFIPILVGIDLFSGVTGFSIFGGNVAHFAHVGGALIGFIIMWYWKKNSFNHHRWDK